MVKNIQDVEREKHQKSASNVLMTLVKHLYKIVAFYLEKILCKNPELMFQSSEIIYPLGSLLFKNCTIVFLNHRNSLFFLLLNCKTQECHMQILRWI